MLKFFSITHQHLFCITVFALIGGERMRRDEFQENEEFNPFDGRLCAIEVASRLGGMECAEALVRHFGGMRLYFPIRLSLDHRLIAALGEACARAICEEIGGIALDIPVRHRIIQDAIVRRFTEAGETTGKCAHAAGVSERQVYHIRRRLGIKSTLQRTPKP